MDNITHSLLGLAVGEATVQLQKGKKSDLPYHTRLLFWLASFFGNNAPDVDIVFNLFSPDRIFPYLSHRGHTHTVVVGSILAFGGTAFLAAGYRWRGWQVSLKHWGIALGLAFLGVLLHLFADSWNSYGVHPFWPFDNHWYYGDFIFIIEPFLWFSMIPAVWMATQNRFQKNMLIFLGVVLVGLIGLGPFVPSPIRWILLAWAGLMAASTRLSARKRIAVCFVAIAATLGSFWSVGRFTRQQISLDLKTQKPSSQLLDLVLSPSPGNFFCWTFTALESESDVYRLEAGIFAPFSSFLPVEKCPQILTPEQRPSPLVASKNPNSASYLWKAEFQGSIREFQTLAHTHCWVRNFLQFVRTPIWEVNSEQVGLADQRYYRGNQSARFGSMLFESKKNTNCPGYLFPWIPPRLDLLSLR